MQFLKFDFLGNLILQLVDDTSLRDTPKEMYFADSTELYVQGIFAGGNWGSPSSKKINQSSPSPTHPLSWTAASPSKTVLHQF